MLSKLWAKAVAVILGHHFTTRRACTIGKVNALPCGRAENLVYKGTFKNRPLLQKGREPRDGGERE